MKANHGFPLGSALGALGIVYGDIGTSVLYAFRECLAHSGRHQEEILGILSLIIWTLTLLVTFKYLTFVMRADNQGEGGILALLSLAFPESVNEAPKSRLTIAMIGVGLIGAALLYGDGVITPAISVLSATEGLTVAAPWLAHFSVPLTVVILVLLFAFQRKGTESVVKAFWTYHAGVVPYASNNRNHPNCSLSQRLCGDQSPPRPGVSNFTWDRIAHNSGQRFSSGYGCRGALRGPGALRPKADCSRVVRVVFPSLLLNYFGQGALVLRDPSTHESPFFHMVPSWSVWPLIALATAATVIASQALISGAFSLTMQAVQMGYVPFINIRHTSHEEHGQIYIPQINTLLAIGCIALVIGFRKSEALASAYGIAVTLTMLATTLLLYFAARRVWKWSRIRAGALCAIPLVVEGAFFTGNSLKVLHGGWLPLAIGAVVFLQMTTWKKGRYLLRKNSRQMLSLTDLIISTTALDESGLPCRVPGTAVFLSAQPKGAPASLLHNIRHNRVLHQRNIVLTIVTDRIPYVQKSARVEIKDLSHGFFRIIAHFGFMETPTIGEVIQSCALKDFVIEEHKTSFFLGRETIIPTGEPGMARWREHLFVAMSHHAQRPAEFFKLPVTRTIELGGQVEI